MRQLDIHTNRLNMEVSRFGGQCIVFHKCRLYTEVQVSTLFTQPRAEGPRLCKSRRDRTEVYNGLVPWAMWP